MYHLIDEIKSLVTNEHGKINPCSASSKWWENNGRLDLYRFMLSSTSFIESGTPKEYARRLCCLFNGFDKEPTCETCGVLLKYNAANKSYPKYCRLHVYSDEMEAKRNGTMLERYGEIIGYGSDMHKAKSDATLMQRFGTTEFHGLDEVLAKKRNTNIERYGVSEFTQSTEYIVKSRETYIEKYGVDHHMKLEGHAKCGDNHPNYKNWHEFSDSIILDYTNGMPKCEVAKKYGYSISHMNKIILWLGLDGDLPQNKVARPSYTSKAEEEIADFVASLGYEAQRNVRNVIGEELDIYIPDLQIAIEYNGDYWHSDSIRNKKHTIEKLEKCEAKGIHLVTIQEHVFRDNKAQILGKLSHKLQRAERRIYARNTVFSAITSNECNDFLNLHHVQGSRQKSAANFGLTCDGELVAVATFKKFRDGVEIVRYATSCNVIGGLSKLLANTHYHKIYSFADRRYTSRSNNIYLASGFKEIEISPQSYVYFKGNVVLSRQQCMKHKLPEMLTTFDADRTEYENMRSAGFHRVWDCGNLLYLMEK